MMKCFENCIILRQILRHTKQGEMSATCRTYEREKQIDMKVQKGNLNGKRALEAPKRGQENNIKIDLIVIGYKDVNRIKMAPLGCSL